MRAAAGILTQRGGMTSHAALVARGWGKCCIVGCSELELDNAKKTVKMGGKTYKEGDSITLNGTKGWVYDGALKMLAAGEGNKNFGRFLKTGRFRAHHESTRQRRHARRCGKCPQIRRRRHRPVPH